MIQYIPPHNHLNQCKNHILATNADYFANLREPNLDTNLKLTSELEQGDIIWMPVVYKHAITHIVIPEYRKYYVNRTPSPQTNQNIELMQVSHQKSTPTILSRCDICTTLNPYDTVRYYHILDDDYESVYPINQNNDNDFIQVDRCYWVDPSHMPTKVYCEQNEPAYQLGINIVRNQLTTQLLFQDYINDDYQNDGGIIIKCDNSMQFHKIKCNRYPEDQLPTIINNIRQHPDTLEPLTPSAIQDNILIQHEYLDANAQDIACLLAIGKYRRSRHLNDIKTALRVHDYDRIQQIVEPQSQPIIIEPSEPESPIEPTQVDNEAQPVEQETQTTSTDEQSETNSSSTLDSTDSNPVQSTHHHVVHHRHHHDDDLEL